MYQTTLMHAFSCCMHLDDGISWRCLVLQIEAQSLRASNNELNRRLEALMQRLELSASQSSLTSGREPANPAAISALLPGASTLDIPQDDETDGRPVMQSAPTTPAQQRRPLRAPQGEALSNHTNRSNSDPQTQINSDPQTRINSDP